MKQKEKVKGTELPQNDEKLTEYKVKRFISTQYSGNYTQNKAFYQAYQSLKKIIK